MADPDPPDSLPTQQWQGPGAETPVPVPKSRISDSAFEAFMGKAEQRTGVWQPPTPQDLHAQFPPYEVAELLGRGGMGAVYKAWQTSLDRFVAIKILPPQFGQDDLGFAERFKREAKALARLKHPGIIAVYDAGSTPDGLLYFIMEYVEGTDLQRLIAAEGRLPMAQAVAIVSKICDALAYAHDHGIVHRDIKPANVMIERDGTVKVADFGLAKSTVANTPLLTQSHVAMGTPDFMAPEALLDTGHVDHRADLYALGVMLYQMLTGRLPRGRFDPASQSVVGLDKRVDRVIDRALKQDPAARYSSAMELRSDLDLVLTRISRKQPAMTGPKARRPIAMWACVGAAAVAGAMALLPFAPWKKSPEKVPAGVEAVAGVHDPGKPASLRPAATAPATILSTTTKDSPFVNSLGMKFVPVPIQGGPTGGKTVLFSVWDTRVRDYAAYAGANKVDASWTKQQRDGVPAGRELNHPVVGVLWEDAQGFCEWLTEKEQAEGKLPKGLKYRLPSDEEWSWAVGLPPELGGTPAEKSGKNSVDFPWGKDYPPTKQVGNYADETLHAKFPKDRTDKTKDQPWIKDYTDGYATTSPVGSFPANAYGLYDMGGNVWQWCEDWFDKDQKDRVIRGASWAHDNRGRLLSSYRHISASRERYADLGFRCVLAPVSSTPNAAAAAPIPAVSGTAADGRAASPRPPGALSESALPSAASKDAPFVNTLEMKFVPVPIQGGPTEGQRVLFSVWDTRVQDYAAYAKASKVDDSWTKQTGLNNVPVGREPNHPVVGVSWADAQGFCQWLTIKERAEGMLPKEMKYRLPTDEEWSWAVGLPPEAGRTPADKTAKNQVDFPWGRDFPPPDKVGNYADESFHARYRAAKDATAEIPWIEDYDDGYPTTSPVGTFPANAHGLYDMGGNVWQWCEDWYDASHQDRVLRGASWDGFDRGTLISSFRLKHAPGNRAGNYGFRCVLAPADSTLPGEGSKPEP